MSSDPEFPAGSRAGATDLPQDRRPDLSEPRRRRSWLLSVELVCSSLPGRCRDAAPEDRLAEWLEKRVFSPVSMCGFFIGMTFSSNFPVAESQALWKNEDLRLVLA